MLEFYYPDHDDNPHTELVIGDGVSVEAHWFNTSVFTHRFLYRNIDHVFWGSEGQEEYELDDGQIVTEGIFLFRQRVPGFDELAFDLIAHDFTHIHQPIPNTLDIKVYDRQALDD